MLQVRLQAHVPVKNNVAILSSVLNFHNLEIRVGMDSNFHAEKTCALNY